MLPDAIAVKHIVTAAGATDARVEETMLGVVCHVPLTAVADVLEALRDSEPDFRMLADLLGVDTGEDIEITYHLRSLARDEDLYVRSRLPYDGALPSVWNVFPSALLPERETAELFGLMLESHPNPRRLLTTDGVAPLLRKSVAIRTAEEVRQR